MVDQAAGILAGMHPTINLVDLGRRVRAARLSRRLTLEEVVSRADFTVSWLSKLENGLLAPSLEGLVRLGEVLECGIEELVAGLSARPKYAVTRQGERHADNGRASRNGLSVERLADSWWGRAIEPVILNVSGTGNRKAPDSHAGERFLHVLDGDIKIQYGDELIVLGPGDSVYLDAVIPHSLAPDGRGTARVLSVSFDPSRNGHAQPAGKAHKKPRGQASASRT
jgi:transcriptional regulator with XRE-family HTH domain